MAIIDSVTFNKLTAKELITNIKALRNTVNSRYYRLKKMDVESPALKSFISSGGPLKLKKITTVNNIQKLEYKDINELRAEYARALNFVDLKTSTVTGFKKYRKEVETAVGGFESLEQERTYWSIYNKIKENNFGLFAGGRGSPTKARSIVAGIYKENSNNIGEVIARATAELKKEKERGTLYDIEEKKFTDVFSFDGKI